jgi:hypothetical protein
MSDAVKRCEVDGNCTLDEKSDPCSQNYASIDLHQSTTIFLCPSTPFHHVTMPPNRKDLLKPKSKAKGKVKASKLHVRVESIFNNDIRPRTHSPKTTS